MSTSPLSGGALRVRDAEIDCNTWEHLRSCESPLYCAAAHARAKDDLRERLRELLDGVLARLALLSRPAQAQGDAPLPQKAAGRISQSLHG